MKKKDRKAPTGQCKVVLDMIIGQCHGGAVTTPYRVARELNYPTTGRISVYLRWLEDEGWIIRTSISANEVEIMPI